jgi:hypothetical protein
VPPVNAAADSPKDDGKKGLRVSGDVTQDIMYYLQVTSMAEIRECFEDVRGPCGTPLCAPGASATRVVPLP